MSPTLGIASILLLFAESCLSASVIDPLTIYVNTTGGMLRGKLSEGVYRFFGIPYAESPVGDRRFRPTEPKKRMPSTHDATKFGSICPQTFMDLGPDYDVLVGNFSMSEDCLVLNVYVPRSVNNNNKKTVMVWIHGGGYITGTGNTYDASLLASLHDVIVITVNYRLGILGFLSTMDDNAPGNLGLRDQILALGWVQMNVGEFGGDKDRVTIFGESAGGGSVTQLALSPMSRGLFHRIIAESGNPFAPWASVKNPFKKAKDLARGLSCPTTSTDSIVECLRGKTMEELLHYQTTMMAADFTVMWGPTYGNEFLPFTESELRNNVKNLSIARQLSDIDMIIGLCSQEGAMFYKLIMEVMREKLGIDYERDGITEGIFDTFISPWAKALTRGTNGPENYFLPSLNYMYSDWTQPDNGLARSARLIQALSDIMFNVGAIEFARLHASLSADMDDTDSDGATYFYRFNQRGSWMTPNSWRSGADHGDDIFFVFGYPLSGLINATSEERKFSRDVMTYWTNFAKTG